MSQINVNTIANASGTSAVTIDSSGRITNSTPVYAQGSHNVDNSGTVTFTTRMITSGGCTFEDSNTAMKVPVDGLYMIHFDCLGDTGSGNLQISAKKNGTTIGSSFTQDTDSGNDGVSKTILSVLQADDKITFVINAGASHGNSQYNNFFVVKIG